MNGAIEQYCDAIAIAEKKTSTGVTMVAFTEKLMGARASEPKDIEQEVFFDLC